MKVYSGRKLSRVGPWSIHSLVRGSSKVGVGKLGRGDSDVCRFSRLYTVKTTRFRLKDWMSGYPYFPNNKIR